MKPTFFCRLLFCLAFTLSQPASAQKQDFSFGFIAHPFDTPLGEAGLVETLEQTEKENLAFVVVGGIKSAREPCSDKLYEQRLSLLDAAKHGVVVSIAASDWSACRYSNGKLAAIERLNRIRELFFSDEMSLGSSKIPLTRQSVIPKFRDYAENMRWEIGDIMFATLHLPANNNRYLTAAGRNNEFEDRLVANHDWLQRIVLYAKRKKHAGIVIFSDGNLMVQNGQRKQRDGFKETREYLLSLSKKFSGKILLIHNQSAYTPSSRYRKIQWQGSIGSLTVQSGLLQVAVSSSNTTVFSIAEAPKDKVTRLNK